MRHQAKGRQLSRTSEHRRALMRNMATSLILHGGIETTVAKAKELRPYTEKLITLARRGDLHARRLVAQKIRERDALARLFSEIGPRFAARPGGYTRILKLGHRSGDCEVARIELPGTLAARLPETTKGTVVFFSWLAVRISAANACVGRTTRSPLHS
jgi:large subunit ribosomal protein L17